MRDDEFRQYSKVGVTWDHLEVGDLLLLPRGDGSHMTLRLLGRCVNDSVERWHFKCACGSPGCSQEARVINVRTAMSNEGVFVARRKGLSIP